MNRIGALRFNMAVGDQATAFAMRQKLRSEWQEKMLPILDECLNRLGVGNRWLHIRNLEIHVKLNEGQALDHFFYQQCHRELNQLLSSLSDSNIHDYPEGKSLASFDSDDLPTVNLDSSAGSATDAQPIITGEWDIVLTYLTSGQLPWFMDASEFKNFLSKKVRTHRGKLISTAINARQLAVWFRTVDLLLGFTDPDWGDELIEQLSTEDSVLTPVYRRMLKVWVERCDIQPSKKIEKILTILAFSNAKTLYEGGCDSGFIIAELTANTWWALIDSVPDWSGDEQERLRRAVPGVLKAVRHTPQQAGDMASVAGQATTDAMQALPRKNRSDEEKGEPGDTRSPAESRHKVISVSVDHAGLVILAPFLSRFLLGRGIEVDDRRIKHAHLPKAAALLYALVRGNDECREYDLGFIKFLLGIDFDSPLLVVPGELSQDDFEEVENLINTVIGHWTAVGNLSLGGFRRSFLERTAVLTEESNGWNLSIERAGHDVLIDRLPWALQMVHLPWMQKPINVNW